MKVLALASLFVLALSAHAAPAAQKKTLPAKKSDMAKTTAPDKKAEADCDEKAKKPIEIKQDTISLTGNAGCSLDEMKK